MEQMQLGERKVLHLKLDAIYTFLLLDVFGELSMTPERLTQHMLYHGSIPSTESERRPPGFVLCELGEEEVDR